MDYTRYQGWNCGHGRAHGAAAEVGEAARLTVHGCTLRCNADLDCSCMEYERATGVCYLKKRSACEIDKARCQRSQTTDVYLQNAVWGKDPWRATRNLGRNCKNGQGAIENDTAATAPRGQSLDECRGRCAADEACTCYKWHRTGGDCYKMQRCDILKCAPSNTFDVYVQEAVMNGYASRYNGTAWIL